MKTGLPHLASAALALTIALPAVASDLGKVRQQQPDDSFTSNVSIFDIERCMIEVDAVATPTVFRQPDRPEAAMIAWDTMILVELKAEGSGASVKTHFQNPGGRKARKRLLACAGQNVD